LPAASAEPDPNQTLASAEQAPADQAPADQVPADQTSADQALALTEQPMTAQDSPSQLEASLEEASPSQESLASSSEQASSPSELTAPAPEQADTEQPNSGEVQTGWTERDGMRYYLASDGTPLVGEQNIDGSWYYFDPAAGGAMQTGFARIASSDVAGCFKTAYFGEDGKRLSGLCKIGSSTYLFDEDTGAQVTGFATLVSPEDESDGASDAKIEFFDLATGEQVTGEVSIHGDKRYFDPETGEMETGFIAIADDGTATDAATGKYAGRRIEYFDPFDGAEACGLKCIGGENYWFDPATGSLDLAQTLRLKLNNAPSSSDITTFNGGSIADWALDGIRQAVDAFARQGYRVGFVMMDLDSGKGVCSRIDETFYSASTIKALNIASLYDKVFNDDTAASAGWRQVLERTCVQSDNDAYAALRRAFGNQCFASWLSETGVSTDKAGTSNCYYAWYTPRDLAKMWAHMYSYFQDAGAAGSELSSMLSHGYNSSIYNELGGEYAVCSKPGWYPTEPGYTATNDAGIVYAGKPYLVSILSDAPERFDLVRSLVRSLNTAHDALVG
jgi:hypothetical protein